MYKGDGVLKCDVCGLVRMGARPAYATRLTEALMVRKEARGWIREKRAGVWQDVCPTCQKRDGDA